MSRRPGRRRGRTLAPAALGALLLGIALPAPASAQDVRLAGPPRTDAQRALADFLARGGYELWTRDTVLARGDTVPGHLLVLEASVRIAGRVAGDIFVVDGDLFLRTRSSVAGDLVVLGGGFYDSDLAEVVGAITYRPNERVRVRPAEGGFEIIHETAPRPVYELDGTAGVRLPTYQRVDALTLEAGGLVRGAGWPGRPELEAVARFKTGPSEIGLAGRASLYLSDRVRVGLFGAWRETRTNEVWIRPTWYNSLAHFVAGDDARDYREADEVRLELELVSPEPPVWEDAAAWRLALAAGREDASSLEARDVTVLFGADPIAPAPPLTEPLPPYPNPRIDDGSLFFVRAGFEWSKRGREGRVAFGLGLEAGFEDDIPGEADEFDFLLVEGRFSGRRVTPWGHAVDAFLIGRADLSGVVPRQRWTTIGGVGTVPTLPLRGRRGSRLAYAELTYAAPLLGVATLGGLDAFVRGSAGGVGSDAGFGSGGVDFDLDGSVAGGLAARLWDFQLEGGVAAGSSGPRGRSEVVVFFDVRVARSARPSQMPAPGRGF